MKKKLPISAILIFLFLYIINHFFLQPEPKNKFTASYTSHSTSVSEDTILNKADTTDILNRLCEHNVYDSGLIILNYCPCEWREDYGAEAKGTVSAFSIPQKEGIIGMGLLINSLPYEVSKNQIKSFFSIEKIKQIAKKSMAISYRKLSLSGVDYVETVFKKVHPIEAPESVAYAVHYETIYANKYVTLSYIVSYKDAQESKNNFNKFLPIFRSLFQKFKLNST